MSWSLSAFFLSVFFCLGGHQWAKAHRPFLFFECGPLSKGDVEKLKFIKFFFLSVLLCQRGMSTSRSSLDIFLVMCSFVQGWCQQTWPCVFEIAHLSKGELTSFNSLAIVQGDVNELKFVGFFFLECVRLSMGNVNDIKFFGQFFLSLLVYPTFVSLAMFSFEFVPLSKELIDKFLFVDIFFWEL